jgi:TnpA family transposase
VGRRWPAISSVLGWSIVATRVFSDEELARLRGFPEITGDDLIRFFTLSQADLAFVDPGRGRSARDRAGLSVQLCTLPWLGFVPDAVTTAPLVAVSRLAEQLRVSPKELTGYGEREQTRTDHLRLVLRYLGWRTAGRLELKELGEFLLARAMEHDSPSLLFRLAGEHLRTSRVVRPGVVTLIERVAAARTRAERETYGRIAHLLTETRRAELDGLLVTDPELGMARLRWLHTGPAEASAAAVKTEVRKLLFLRGLDAHSVDLSALPAERRRFLAAVGRRSSVAKLARRDPQRLYPILLTLLAQSATDVLDEVVQLFDQALSARESRAKHKLVDQLAERAKTTEDKLAIAEQVLPVLADPGIPDDEVGGLLRERIGMSRLRAALAEPATTRLPRDHGQLAQLARSYNYLRQFTPPVLDAIAFAGGPAVLELLEAVGILRTLNTTGARRVPADAPSGFVPIRWRGYLDDAIASGDSTAYRHYWELCVLLCLRDGLRSGDVYVPGSRRYANPLAYLIPTQAWPTQREEFCRLVAIAADPHVALAAVDTELTEALAELEQVLTTGDGPVRLDANGELVIGPLSAEDVPSEAGELREELTALLPFAPLASVLIELDRRTGFLDSFTHAGGAKPRSRELKRNLIAVIIAQSTNLGLARTADACDIAYDTLAWTQEWYVREETLRAANLMLIDYHQRLPLTPLFGGGTLSSSDGQRFPTKGKSLTARALSRYFSDQGVSTYSHVTDQHAVYGTKVIVATEREAPYVLDEILGNATDLPITEHATDTHGASLLNFALFDLVGLQLSPRIRDLGKITLTRTNGRAEVCAAYPHAGPLLTRRINTALIAENFDEMLRLGASLKYGHVTASLIVAKLSRADRQNTLATALKEYGALRRTIYAARYLARPDYRRKIGRQLNKGESIHALRRDVFYAHEGAIRRRHLQQQTDQAWCLTLTTNAITAWTCEYLGLAVQQLRDCGRQVDQTLLAHLSPAQSQGIGLIGTITVDIDAELARLDPTGHRPLRPPAAVRPIHG